jgi:chemotaxis protein histidine kinase CheA
MNGQTREQKEGNARSRLAELAAKFLDRTDGDIAAMRASVGRMASGDPAAVDDIRHLAHRMVGTGATLGFDSLSGLAHHLEKLAESRAPGAEPDEAACAQYAAALDALAADLRKLRGG